MVWNPYRPCVELKAHMQGVGICKGMDLHVNLHYPKSPTVKPHKRTQLIGIILGLRSIWKVPHSHGPNNCFWMSMDSLQHVLVRPTVRHIYRPRPKGHTCYGFRFVFAFSAYIYPSLDAWAQTRSERFLISPHKEIYMQHVYLSPRTFKLIPTPLHKWYMDLRTHWDHFVFCDYFWIIIIWLRFHG
jgi:hypothetical protein